MEHVEYHRDDRVATLVITNPPVNALSAAVQESLRDALRRAMNDSDVEAVVLIGSGHTFVAGADIKQLQSMAHHGAVHSILPQMLMDLEAAPKPVVAAIHGHALGGGLEMAMAAHYRVAAPGAMIGQPEVKIGIIPGAGGTQRLVRLAGVEAALEMCVFGEPIHVEDAQRLGIIDRISDGDLLADAIALAREAIGRAPRRTRDAADKLGTPESNALLFATYQERVRKTRKNLLAPLAAIDAVVAATQLPFPDGCHKERELFERLLVSSQAKAFIHVFLAERAATKSARATATSPPRPLQSAAVIGAGTMGRGIAMCLANAGVPVRVKETSAERLDAAMEAVHATYQSAVRKGRMSEADMRSRVSQIHPQLDDTGLDAVDLAIEAAFENLGVKRAVFAELSALTKPTAILATNTSYLNIDEIATACARPGMTLGLHFFSPAHVMRLLEIVPGKATTPSATATAFAYAKRLGKLAILAGNGPGFIGNRMLRVYRRQAQWLLEEGASPREVDVALEAWGMAMGPFTAQDLAGIDIAMGSRHVFVDVDTREGDDPRVIDVLYARGRLGQKTGAGWYRYDETRVPLPDPDVGACIEEVARARGITRRSVPPEEIVERTIFALVNEGARILEEGHALRASDIDLVYINGFGFPAYRGGPMHYADEVGLPVVYTRLVELQTLHGSQWEPSPLLTRLAETGGSFEEWDNRDVNVDQSIVSQSRP